MERGCLFLSLRVYAPLALGYTVSYIFRNANAIAESQLTEEMGLSAYSLGALTSAYLCSFAAFQLPGGVCLDHFGPRRAPPPPLPLSGSE